MRRQKHLLPALVLVLTLACLPAAAQERAFVSNPLSSAEVGVWAAYDFHLRSPVTSMVGTLRLELKNREGGVFTLTEELGHGMAGKVTSHSSHKLAGNFVDQVGQIYGKSFPGYKLEGAKTKSGVPVKIGKRTFTCNRVTIRFTGTQQKLACRGDLVYYLSSGIGPLHMVKFVSTISFRTEGSRDYSLTQETTLVLSDWKR